jgi:DNA-directed RNA polymerase
MLDFIYTYTDKFNLLLAPISRDNINTRISKTEYNKLESYVSKLDLQENILGLAKVFSNIKEFYLPVRIDYRGRMNCVSQYLNYQSTELAKSLLLFSNGEKLMKNDSLAISYFKAYGANCYGNKLDKKS